MPPLSNQRQERFCQEIVINKKPPYRAYVDAGYKKDNGAPYRMSGYARVANRIAELREQLQNDGLDDRERIKLHMAWLAFADIDHKTIKPELKQKALKDLAHLEGFIIERSERRTLKEGEQFTTASDLIEAIKERLLLTKQDDGSYGLGEETES